MSKEIDLGKVEGKFETIYLSKTDYEDLQKKVKAFDVIKEKRVDVNWLLQCFTHTKELESYNQDRRHKLTQEEFELLKEVLL